MDLDAATRAEAWRAQPSIARHSAGRKGRVSPRAEIAAVARLMCRLLVLLHVSRAHAQPAATPKVSVDLGGSLTLTTETSSGGARGSDPPPSTCSLSPEVTAALLKEDTLLVLHSNISRSDGATIQDAATPACAFADGRLSSPVACLPYIHGGGRVISYRPNKHLSVYVVHADSDPPQYASSASATPTQALTPMGVIPAKPPGLVGIAAVAPCVVDRYQFAPRAPGAFTITTQLQGRDGKTVPGSLRGVELVVESVYVGAIRISAALTFPVGGVHAWSVQPTKGGSAIHEDGYSPMAFELVAGYTWFFPCSRPTTRTLSNVHWGWFNGLGLVSVAPVSSISSGITVFSSLYSGLEVSGGGLALEVLPLGVRRGTDLASPYTVGQHVAAGSSVPTTTGFHYAFALAVSMSSDVFKVAGATVP